MGKHEPNLAVTKTKAVLTGYTGLFQEVFIMKFINIKYIYAMRIAKAIQTFIGFESIDGFCGENLSVLDPTYNATLKAWLGNEDNDQFFMIPLPNSKEGANLLCRALRLYTASEAIYWGYNSEMKNAIKTCNDRLCKDILAKYE